VRGTRTGMGSGPGGFAPTLETRKGEEDHTIRVVRRRTTFPPSGYTSPPKPACPPGRPLHPTKFEYGERPRE
jgi:hypothetical protein